LSVPETTDKWNNKALFFLLWPLVIEQVLNLTIGVADTVMVSGVGEFAVSGVSLVDAIAILFITAFQALATGGSVVVSQYIGRGNTKKASLASKQLIYLTFAVSLVFMTGAVIFRRSLLYLVYGAVDQEVMHAAQTYFWITALSYPGMAVYNASAALFRAMGKSRVTMLIALLVNVMNVGGNALLIYGLRIGVAGAGIATLVSRTAAAAVSVGLLMVPAAGFPSLKGLFRVRIVSPMMKSILRIGVPSGLENSMFQLGKILVSRVFAYFGTAAIAANAIANAVNSMSYMPGQAFGMAMVTVVGQSVGAGDYAAARRYAAKILKGSTAATLFVCVNILLWRHGIVGIFNLSEEARELALHFLTVYAIITPPLWSSSFCLPNALRAAGDARFCMIISVISMWTMRVSGAYLLAFPLGLGSVGVVYSMGADFVFRATAFISRWRHGRWQGLKVIEDG
jgi:putative MATE family efflux protein